MMQLLAKQYKHFIFYIKIILILVSILFIYNFIPIESKIKTFYLASSKPEVILKTLHTHGYTTMSIDSYVLTLFEIPQPGWYTVSNKKYGRFSFYSSLHTMKTNALMKVVIYAGETKEEISHRLANDMKLNKKELLKQYNALSKFTEGDILADSYTLARKAEENATMRYLFDTSFSKLALFEDKNITIGDKTRTLKELIIIASIIQKESNSISEMPIISSVIYNRLNKNMHLQMDATLNYGQYAHTIVSKSRIRNDTSPYNTYKHKGLPPHPLSSVTLNALNATLKPPKNAYIFFMLNPTGTHTFSETYKEHLEKVSIFRQYRAKLKEIKLKEKLKHDTNKTSSKKSEDWIKKFEKF
ncbi:MAG: endolytic transglycosylase MltG [Sulfurovum sp.]|nr:endolytic transglycosylase MltG [Sulfurovum sp.]